MFYYVFANACLILLLSIWFELRRFGNNTIPLQQIKPQQIKPQQIKLQQIKPQLLQIGNNIPAKQSKHKFIGSIIWNRMKIDPFMLKWIDTEEFQSMRDCKQLGSVFLVFPSATHDRFIHSIETSHVARLWLEHFRNVEGISLSERTIQLVTLAALLHDIGHLCLSHGMEHLLKKHNLPTHEQIGVLMIRHMAKKYRHLDLSEVEVEFVCAMILGTPIPNYEPWLFVIVANHLWELDVDKVCYTILDSHMCGMGHTTQFISVLSKSKVINGTIAFHKKSYHAIYDLFHKRYEMFREVYQHHAVLCVNNMFYDQMDILWELNDWKTLFQTKTPSEWRSVTDIALRTISYDETRNIYKDDPSKKVLFDRIVAIDGRIKRREWYKMTEIPTFQQDNQSIYCRNCQKNVNADDESHTIDIAVFGLCSSQTNPMNKIWFYDDAHEFEINDCDNVFNINSDHASQMISPNASESHHYLICRL